MNFTAQIPTEPGAYWWRKSADREPDAVEVLPNGQMYLRGGITTPYDAGGFWCGPLFPAEAVVPSILGECIIIGDDEDGQPRLIIHTTREQIIAFKGNMLFKKVAVCLAKSDAPSRAGVA